jgi:two-component system chemotaxis sensor kinase CheA
MDVVKRNVEASGGSISVTSSPGMGSEFMLRLPKSVTTQIMQGFVVRVHDVSLVLPLNQVQESWSLRAGDITDVVSLGPQVIRHEKVLPLLNLPEFLHLGAGETGEQNQLVVTIDSNSQLLALRVDDIIGPRQVVLKPLDASTNGEQLFLGGALLGDGTVALVLDVAKLHASAMSNLVPEKTGLH